MKDFLSIVESQNLLISNFEGIRTRLTYALNYQGTQSSSRGNNPTPENILHLDVMIRFNEEVVNQISATSKAVTDLVKRVQHTVTVKESSKASSTDSISPKASRSAQSPGNWGNLPSQPSSPSSYKNQGPLGSETLILDTYESPKPALPKRRQAPLPEPPISAPIASTRTQSQYITSNNSSDAPPPVSAPIYSSRTQSQYITSDNSSDAPPPVLVKQNPQYTGPQRPLQNVSTHPGTYCTGALRLQRDKNLNLHDIVNENFRSLSTILGSVTCRYCNLELDTSLWQKLFSSEQHRNEVASQHILACASLVDRRAMFRCYVCGLNGLDAEFKEVGEFEVHLKAHYRSTDA